MIVHILIIPQISAGDVDFFHKDHVQLRMEEEEGMYPPKFTVGLLSREAAESTKACFDFHGATKKISMDIPLHLESTCAIVSMFIRGGGRAKDTYIERGSGREREREKERGRGREGERERDRVYVCVCVFTGL